MRYTIQLNERSIIENVYEQIGGFYLKACDDRPPSEDTVAENLFFEILADLSEHFIAFGHPEPEDFIESERLEEELIFQTATSWFRIYFVASLEHPSRGGGFSCCLR